MKTVKPSYYCDFKCIADKCKHSCCIGWEIDIDENSLEFYKSVGGKFGEKIKENMDFECETPHFILKENERCPFLLENGLCDMYINLGEDKLCEICTLHPRFRNFLTDRVEIGLGLCCEEAVRIILSNKDKTFFTIDKEENENLNSDEEEILSLRSEIIDILQNRKENILDRFLNAFSLFDNCVLPERNIKYWAEKFSELESLDDKWTDILYKLQNYDFENDFEKVLLKYETEFEQLSVYFIYRHFIKAVDDFCEKEYLQFAFLSVYMISSIFSMLESEEKNKSSEDLYDLVRTYSSEIEYSDENLEEIINILSESNI